MSTQVGIKPSKVHVGNIEGKARIVQEKGQDIGRNREDKQGVESKQEGVFRYETFM